MRRNAAQTREHVLQIAHDLFYWHGIRAVGVDRIAAEAGVAPTTLYRLFASKDDLIAAYVERAGRLYREWFDAVVADDGRGPRDRILALFDALTEQVQPQQCRGCPFLMALAEIPDRDHPAHRHAVGTKTWVRVRLGELTAATGADNPAELADQLALTMEGVYASVQALGERGPARRARALAELLLSASGGSGPATPTSGRT
ncbi:TetR/AcrR family transcriptional regulator [Streptosporangium sp. G11]|uniref:TetR/AcrR family transcriptional regulator n=1 Tax=Streptosporangium sp. G11 TaxID=3436926 RepID=UPI003EBDF5EE